MEPALPPLPWLILWSCKVLRQALPPLKHHDGREGALWQGNLRHINILLEVHSCLPQVFQRAHVLWNKKSCYKRSNSLFLYFFHESSETVEDRSVIQIVSADVPNSVYIQNCYYHL